MQTKEALDLHAGKSQAPLNYYESVSETEDAAAAHAYREAVAAKEATLFG